MGLMSVGGSSSIKKLYDILTSQNAGAFYIAVRVGDKIVASTHAINFTKKNTEPTIFMAIQSGSGDSTTAIVFGRTETSANGGYGTNQYIRNYKGKTFYCVYDGTFVGTANTIQISINGVYKNVFGMSRWTTNGSSLETYLASSASDELFEFVDALLP